MKFLQLIVCLSCAVLGRSAYNDGDQQFTVTNVSNINPSRYHAIGLFNNDHPSRKRLAVRKCQPFNFLFPVKIFSTDVPFFCSAVFISADSLLTSALCLKMMQHLDEHPSNHMFAMVDREEVFFYEHGRRYVSKIFFHPKFEDEPAYYNVAIVKLRNAVYERDATGRSHVACLWTEPRLKNPRAILGEWFEFQPEQNPAFRWLDLPVISKKECSAELARMKRPLPELSQGVQDFQVCVRDNRNNSLIRFCEPRSSGPLIMSLGSTVYVTGLPTVHIEDCAVDVEVFNRVSHYIDWIESVVWPGQE